MAHIVSADRLKDVALRVHNQQQAVRFSDDGAVGNRCGLRGSCLGKAAELILGQQVPLLADILRAASAVLI